jgi:hypothetical protein
MSARLPHERRVKAIRERREADYLALAGLYQAALQAGAAILASGRSLKWGDDEGVALQKWAYKVAVQATNECRETCK